MGKYAQRRAWQLAWPFMQLAGGRGREGEGERRGGGRGKMMGAQGEGGSFQHVVGLHELFNYFTSVKIPK
jgi:hypothetical protein